VTRTLSDFEQVIFSDFEFAIKPGERPDVVCLAWHEWPSGQTYRLWRDQLGTSPPYRTDARVLHIHFVSNAELGCHLSLCWPLPVNVLDLNPAFRGITNGRTVPEGRGLHGALAYFHLPVPFDSKRKAELQKRIAKGWPFTVEEREEILRYCASDPEAMVALLPKMLPHIDLDIALHHGEFVAALAHMEHAGVPVDMEIFPQLADQQAWRYVRDAMVPVIDAAYNVYVKSPSGDWQFNMERFAAYLRREGITGWPLTDTGQLSTKRKVFESMTKGHPQLEDLRQLRHTRDKMRQIKLAVGTDGRNRTVLWPFKSKTGRTQPKASQWIFCPAVWLRSLIKPAPGQAVAYVDYSSMEFMIAASLSGDPVMLEFYRSGDPYLTFAKRVGTAPADASKKTHEPLRDRYKTGLLAIQYGVQAETLAGRLGVSAIAAHEMIAQHRELFAVYWQWAADWLARALDTGTMRTVLEWECRTGITEFNARSIQNFPVQAHGADILRIACIWATRYGIGLCAPVHDALLIEAPIERIEADVALLREIMRRASRVVLNPTADGTLELRTDYKIVRYPERYTDRRGDAIWADVLRLLAERRERMAETTAAAVAINAAIGG
jgi:DNA polymerase family A